MTGWLVQNMIGASVVMLAVLLLRTPVARAFGAGWAYALWLLPLVRLLLPPLPELAPDYSLPSLAVIIPAAGDAAASLPPSGGPGQWVPLLLAIWAGGVAAFLIYQFLLYRGFLTRLSLASRSAGAFRGVPLIESGAVDGPIAVGLLDRRIVVPDDFLVRYSEDERRLAAEHEYVHHRRGDIWWNLAALLVLALNWFNPVAWIAFVAFRADQELACDAAVAARTGPSERHDYARALVKSASRPGLIAACPLGSQKSSTFLGSLNHADQLKRRLKMLKDHRTTRLRNLGGAAALVVLAGATLSLSSPGAAHPHAEGDAQTKQQRIIVMEDRDGAAGARGGHDMVIRRGPNGEMQVPEGCSASTPAADVSDGEGDRRTRILLCSRGGGSPADRAANLERARDRIALNEELSADVRARVREQLDREIARLRAR